MYKPVQSARLYEQIVEQIAARIIGGDLNPGDQLPSERELAEQFAVSRTAVREAVKALSEKGMVEVHPGRGTFVVNSTGSAVRHSIDLILRFGQRGGSHDLVEVRAILEPEIAALAAENAKPEDLDAMRQAVDTMDQSLDDRDAFIEADLDFHLALANASHNTIIPVLLDPIVDLLREQRGRIFGVPGGPQRGQMHHKRILKAVESGNGRAARNFMRDHLGQVVRDSDAALGSDNKKS